MSSRDRTLLIVACVLAAIVVPWLLIISPQRSQASKLANQLSAAQSQLDSARAQANANAAAKATFTRSYTTIARLGEAVPADDQVPSLIYQLQGAAGNAHVDFVGLQAAPSSSSTASTAAAAQQGSGSSSPPNATPGANGLANENFTLTFQGSYSDLTNFVNHVQQFVITHKDQLLVKGRLLTVNSINLSAGSKGLPQVVATISATGYLTPKSPSLPIGPSANAATQNVTTTTSGSSPSPTAAMTPPVR